MNEEKLDMIEENVPTSEVEETVEETVAEEVAVSEEATESIADSVKALSPTRLVLKRFFRSKLSIVGLVLIIGLFLFSFLGPLFSPYGETEIDYETDRMNVVEDSHGCNYTHKSKRAINRVKNQLCCSVFNHGSSPFNMFCF